MHTLIVESRPPLRAVESNHIGQIGRHDNDLVSTNASLRFDPADKETVIVEKVNLGLISGFDVVSAEDALVSVEGVVAEVHVAQGEVGETGFEVCGTRGEEVG